MRLYVQSYLLYCGRSQTAPTVRKRRSATFCAKLTIVIDMPEDEFVHWFDALEQRHLSTLNFSEVRRAVQALSSLYVERRDRLDSAAVFNGAGKRAAFSLFFGPLHFLLVREIVRALNA